MQTVIKFSLALLTCSVLAACGSSGGNSSNPTAREVENPKANTNIEKTQNSELSVSTGSVLVVSGHDVEENRRDDDPIYVQKTLKDASDLNVIIVDNKKISISNNDIGVTCCGSFSDLRFGVIDSPMENSFFFYNGHHTKVMPTTGSASYTGKFVINASKHKAFEDEDYLQGKAEFRADFASKELTGSLIQEQLKPIAISANISGNSFVGNASSSDFSSKAKLEGKFYGENAKELGGMFYSKNDWGGAFGATKQ